MSSQKKKIFVSYSGKDKIFVDQLVKDIKKYGIDVWEYSNGIKVGESIPSKIGEELSNADYYVIVLSPNSVTSTWVERELGSAIEIENGRNGRVFIYPILHQECKRPVLISAKRYANFVSSYQLGLRELLKAFGVDYLDWTAEVRSQVLLDFSNRMDDVIGKSDEIIRKKIPLLITTLSENLTGKIVKNAIDPVLFAWREGFLNTLNDVKNETKKEINTWLSSDEARDLIESLVLDWLTNIGKEVSVLIKTIYTEFKFDMGGVWLLQDIHVPVGRMLSLDGIQMELDKGLVLGTGIGLIESIAFILIIAPESLPFLVVIGLAGIVIGGLEVFGRKLKLSDKSTANFERWVFDKNIPKFLRKYLWSDINLMGTSQSNETKVQKELEKILSQNISSKITEQTSQVIHEFIYTQKEKIMTTFK